MPLDPYLAARASSLAGVHDLWSRPDAEELLEEWNTDPGPWQVPTTVTVTEDTAPGPHGPVRVRIYTPEVEPAGTLMWSHGGGFSFGDLDMLEAQIPSAELCARAGWRVVSVDYRLATGGVRYPIPLDDVAAAWSWVHAAYAGPSHPTAIGGASGGAALSLATTMRARDNHDPVADCMLLAYPFSHFPTTQLDDDLAAEIALLPPAVRVAPPFVEEIVRNYVGRISDVPALAVPGGGRMDDLPPAHVMVAELDDLRASGELLQRQIDEAGGETTMYLAAGMVHGHLDRRPSLAEVDRSLTHFAGILDEVAQNGS